MIHYWTKTNIRILRGLKHSSIVLREEKSVVSGKKLKLEIISQKNLNYTAQNLKKKNALVVVMF